MRVRRGKRRGGDDFLHEYEEKRKQSSKRSRQEVAHHHEDVAQHLDLLKGCQISWRGCPPPWSCCVSPSQRLPSIIIIHLLHFFSPTRSYQEQKLDLEQGKSSELILLVDKNHICCFGCFHTKEQIFGVWGRTSCRNCCFERVHNPAWQDPWRRRLWSENGSTIQWVNHPPVGQPSEGVGWARDCIVSGLHLFLCKLYAQLVIARGCPHLADHHYWAKNGFSSIQVISSPQ